MSTKYLWAVIILIIITLFSSCSKDEKISNELGRELSLRSNEFIPISSQNVTNYQGMLYFPSFQDFILVYQELKQMNQNGTLVDDAYEQLGLNQDSEYFITENPISLIFETSFEFNSYRKKEESAYSSFLEGGGDPLNFSSNEILVDDDFKALVNEFGELKIGRKFFRIYEDNNLLIVGENDYNAFISSRELATTEIAISYNVRRKGFQYDDNEYLFDVDEIGLRNEKDIIDLYVQIKESETGELNLVNKSFVDLLNSEVHFYKWVFSDGSTFFGPHPTNQVYQGDAVKLFVLGNNGIPRDSIIIEVRGDPGFCDHKIYHIPVKACIMVVTVEVDWNVTTRVVWTLPDGSTHSGTKISIGNTLRVNTETMKDWFLIRVDLFFNDLVRPDSRWCTRNYQIKRCNCGDTGNNEDNSEVVKIGGRNWRMEVEIWVKDNLFITSVGSKTVSRRKSRLGAWLKKKSDLTYASFKGIIQDGDKLACPDIDLPFEEETEANSSHLERNVNPRTKDPRYIKHMQRCESTHWFIKDGVKVTYPGKLYLN